MEEGAEFNFESNIRAIHVELPSSEIKEQLFIPRREVPWIYSNANNLHKFSHLCALRPPSRLITGSGLRRVRKFIRQTRRKRV